MDKENPCIALDGLPLTERRKLTNTILNAYQRLTSDGGESIDFSHDADIHQLLSGDTATNQRFDAKALQNRDRSRDAYVLQMQKIASNPDYDRLSTSKTPSYGAPMVFSRGVAIPTRQAGRKEVITMSDGKGGTVKIPAVYAVVEADSLLASHDAHGNKVEGYGGEQGLMALNNGRTAALKLAYKKSTADGYSAAMYQEALKQDADSHGVDASVIESMKEPVLVRVFAESALQGIDDPGAASNEKTGAELSDAEQAKTDANKLTASALMLHNGGDLNNLANRDFVKAFIQAMGGADAVGDMQTADGGLSAGGIRRIEAALVARAYGDDATLNDLTESPDSELKSLGDTLKQVAGKWSVMKEAAQGGLIASAMDITPQLNEAIALIRKSRREGSSIAELVGQNNLFTGQLNPVTESLLRMFYRGNDMNRIRSADKIKTALNGYLEKAMQSTAGADMFGHVASPIDEIQQQKTLLESDELAAKSQRALFDSAEFFNDCATQFNVEDYVLDAVADLSLLERRRLTKEVLAGIEQLNSPDLRLLERRKITNTVLDGIKRLSGESATTVENKSLDTNSDNQSFKQPFSERLVSLGWQDKTGNRQWLSKRISGGIVSANNPEGLRSISLEINDQALKGLFGDSVLITLPYDKHLTPEENADNFNKAVMSLAGDQGGLQEVSPPIVKFEVLKTSSEAANDANEIAAIDIADFREAKKQQLESERLQKAESMEALKAEFASKGIDYEEINSAYLDLIKVFVMQMNNADDDSKVSSLQDKRAENEAEAKLAVLQDKVAQAGYFFNVVQLRSDAYKTAQKELEAINEQAEAITKVLVNASIEDMLKNKKTIERQAWTADIKSIQQFNDSQLGRAYEQMEQKGYSLEALLFLVKHDGKNPEDIAAIENLVSAKLENRLVSDGVADEISRRYQAKLLDAKIAQAEEAQERDNQSTGFRYSSYHYDKIRALKEARSIARGIDDVPLTDEDITDYRRLVSQYDEGKDPEVRMHFVSKYGFDVEDWRPYRNRLNAGFNQVLETEFLSSDHTKATQLLQEALKVAGFNLFTLNFNNPGADIAIKAAGAGDVTVGSPSIKEGSVDVTFRYAESSHGSSNKNSFKSVRFNRETGMVLDSLADNESSYLNQAVIASIVNQAISFVASYKSVIPTDDLPAFGSSYDKVPAEGKYSASTYSALIRNAYKEAVKKGDLPKDLKLSVTSSYSSVTAEVNHWPSSLPMYSTEYLKWIDENGAPTYQSDVPDYLERYSTDYRALSRYMNSVAEQWRKVEAYDPYSDYGANSNFHFSYRVDSTVKSDQLERELATLKGEKVAPEKTEQELAGERKAQRDAEKSAQEARDYRELIGTRDVIKKENGRFWFKSEQAKDPRFSSIGVAAKVGRHYIWFTHYPNYKKPNSDEPAPYTHFATLAVGASSYGKYYDSLEALKKAYPKYGDKLDIFKGIELPKDFPLDQKGEPESTMAEPAITANLAPVKTDSNTPTQIESIKSELAEINHTAFYPTHELSDGTPVRAHEEDENVWIDDQGAEYEADPDDVSPIQTKTPSPGYFQAIETEVRSSISSPVKPLSQAKPETIESGRNEIENSEYARICKRVYLSLATDFSLEQAQAAVDSDKEGKRFSYVLREKMAKAVLDHATGADPMPMNGTRYTKEQWDDMRNNWLKNNSMVKVAKSEIAAIEEQVKSYVQKAGREFDERYALFDSGIAGNKSVFTYLGQVICDYRSELYSGYRSDTPEPTIDGFERVKRRVESYCKNSIAKAQLFNDPELYKLGNAQYVIESVNRWKASNPDNYLSDRMVLSLLETYHGIPVDDPRTLSKNTPDGIVIHVKDLLAGTKTVQDCLNREAARTKARNQEKQESQQALVDLLTKAHEILKDKPHTEDFKTKAVNLLRKAGLEVGVRFSGSMAISSGRSFYTAHDEKFPYSTLCFKLAPELSKQKEVLAGKSYKELESDAVLSARASLKAKKENTSSTDYEAEVVVATKRLKPLADAANESTTLQEFTNKYREYLDTPSSYYRNTVSSGRGALRGDRLVEDAMLAYGMDIPDKGFAANFYEKIKTLKSSDEKIPIENTSNTASEAQTWLDEVVEAISKDYDLVESSHYKKDYADAELPSYYIARINVAARKASVKSSFKTGLLEFQRLSNEVTQGKTTLAAVIHNIIKDKPLPDTAEPDAQPWTLPYEEWNKLENKGKYGYLNIDEWRNEVGKAVANGESVSNDIAQQGSLNYIPTEKLSSIFGRFISDIPNSTAANAHRGTSFSSDTRAKQEQVSYALYMSSIEKKLLDFAQTEDEKAIAHTEFEHIREKYRSMTLGMLQSRSGLLSAMIAGPAGMGKYKRRNEKADRAFRSKVESMSEYMPKAIARAKKAIRPETSAIRTDTPDALNLAKKKLDDLVKDQERMKAINKIIRSGKNVKERLMSEFNYKSAQVDELLEPDFGGRIGFPNYMLTNNNANIRRMQERLKELESVSKEIDREFSFEGGKVVVDTDDMRIRIIYDSIPSKEAREKLKGRGFKWSPSNSAWQRQLTDNAKYAVQVVTGINVDIPSVMPKSFDTLSDAAPSDEEENAKLDDDLAALEPKYDSAIQSANQSVFKRTWSIVRC